MAHFLYQLAALAALAAVAWLALWLHHRRKSAALVVARYHAQGDALGWQRVSLIGRKDVRVCPDCGTFTHNYAAQEAHSANHQAVDLLSDRLLELEKLVAELLGGRQREDVKEPPWTAIQEPERAQEVTENTPPELPEPVEDERYEHFREMQKVMARINGKG